MKTRYSILLAAALVLAPKAYSNIPAGSFKGKSSIIKNAWIKSDVMAMIIKKDPKNADRAYAVLAEYDRIPLTNFTVRSAITKWVPRLYAYQIDKTDDLHYAMRTLYVDESGEIITKANVKADLLVLKKAGSLKDAVLTRYKKESPTEVEETIRWKGRVGSTWENYVPGTYLGTQRNSGGDYFSKKFNTFLNASHSALFFQEEISGIFEITEKLPGFFTLKTKSIKEVIKGEEKVVTKIGVFIDIVNWKPLFTTDEFLMINPDNARDVGFYYEKH